MREPFGDQLAPMVALAAAADATRTLRVGTLVLDNDWRHPVLLAKEAATLDLLSGGRFELGIGAGWLGEEYRRVACRSTPPACGSAASRSPCGSSRGCWQGPAFTFAGAHYSVTGLEGFPRPVQRPRPPILVGAASKRMLGIAAPRPGRP
jgi:alkanesulfonate monooxygenase SsuD/methylene tetrahydromethanopterin reductase-like flavin-dependent oxidoreductase (luciferase family)